MGGRSDASKAEGIEASGGGWGPVMVVGVDLGTSGSSKEGVLPNTRSSVEWSSRVKFSNVRAARW